ncbi:hypothetical protein TNCV_472221 [Trichonephila clavipes]|nr:hypothetical protein TNCV_472221 [Trichonephila clavipes]
MSRFGGLSEERPSVFKTRSKLGTHLSTQCSGDERHSRPCAARLKNPRPVRNAINIVQFSDKSTEDFPVICYTDGSKIDGRGGFAFVVFRSGVESENFQFRIRDL